MEITWIVVANASRARFLERIDAEKELRDVADFVHPPSRQKGSELAWDKSGHVEKGQGPSGRGSTQLQPRTDPRRREHEHFARQLAEQLGHAVSDHRCQHLVLIASNPFLGELKSHLSDAALKAVSFSVASDFTSFEGRDLQKRVEEALRPGVLQQ